MKRLLTSRPLILTCRIVMGAVFVYAAMSKIGDVATFSQQIHNYRMVPIWSENLIAMTLPWIEMFAGLSMLLGIRPRGGSTIVTLLMAVFVVAVIVALFTGLDIDCGCFGTAGATRVGLAKLAENLVMLILAFIGTGTPATS
jgi:uncharacterized membrane protein YphA (DoxX/SURF4 family)